MKRVFVINGAGGVGKSSLIKALSSKYLVREISSVDAVKNAARLLGWDGSKDDRSRLLLHGIKEMAIAYNNYPTVDLIRKCCEFMREPGELLFVNIREPYEINKFISAFNSVFHQMPETMLILRPENRGRDYGNDADNFVEAYCYDYCYENLTTTDEGYKAAFVHYFETCVLSDVEQEPDVSYYANIMTLEQIADAVVDALTEDEEE